MSELIRKIKDKGKFRRTLAAWLGVCIIAQTILGSMGILQIYANDTIYKVITVKEKDIMQGVEKAAGNGPDKVPIIKDKILPYETDELNEEAENEITQYLMGTAIVQQKKLGDKCSAIVAVSGEELSGLDGGSDYIAENIVFIGLNGNQKSDCVFTLQIVDAKDVVIRSMTIITYAQDGRAAIASEATSSEASPSESGGDSATPSIATDSEIQGYGFTEVGSREELGEDELEDFVQNGDIATPGEAATPDGSTDPEDAVGPRMLVPAGGFAVAYAESSTNAHGKVAQINAFLKNGEETQGVMSGDIGTFYIAADYSVIDNKLPEYAYFTVEFKIEDHEGHPYENVKGPESEPGAKPIAFLESESQREWKNIKELMAKSETDRYSEAAQYDDWQMITAETNTYFYSETAKLAVFGIRNGGTAITDMPIFFTFDNYITPIGSTITATPGILNAEELRDAYESSVGPTHSGESPLIVGEPVRIASEAKFYWKPVQQVQSGKLGNMASGTNVSDIVYKISASKDYQSDHGRLYTSAYTIRDVITFEGFSLNVEGYTLQYDTTKNLKSLYLKKDGKAFKVISMQYPDGYKAEQIEAVPIYLDGSAATNRIVGFEVRFTQENESMSTGGPADLPDIKENQMIVYLGIEKVIANAKEIIIYDTAAAAATEGRMPSVTSKVYYDAYSIMYDGTADNSALEQNDGVTNHHSEAEKFLSTTAAYSLTKTAYRDIECKTEAKGTDKSFEPGAPVYYKLNVKNNGYTTEPFDVVDTLPDGLDLSTVRTVQVTVGGKKLSSAEYTETVDTSSDSPVKTWGNILIPSGKEAVIIFEASLKKKAEFSENGGSNTTLVNKANWYRSSDAARANKMSKECDATIFVNLNTLKSDDVIFEKSIVGNKGVTDDSVPTIGSDVTYMLHTELVGEVKNSHWVTVKDYWPEGITLKEISGIPSQAVVVIHYNGGTLRYENTTSKLATWKNFNLRGKTDITVEAQVYLAPKAAAEIKLKGTLNTEGEITNKAQVEGNDGEAWEKPVDPVKLYAIGASIEKKAYYISSAQADSITDEISKQHPVDQNVTFQTGDVVCYEMTLKNTGKSPFTANVSDDISELFGVDVSWDYASADLGQSGSVFMKRSKDTGWTKLEEDRTGRDALNNTEVTLAENEAVAFRIYLAIPENATELFPDNKVHAKLYYAEDMEQKFDINASASITITQRNQKASVHKEVYAVGSELKLENDHYYLKGARWNNTALGTDVQGYVPDESILKVGKGDYVFYRLTITNESDDAPLTVYEIEDWLPDGMQFEKLYEFNGNDRVKKIPGVVAKEGDTLDLGVKNRFAGFTSGQKWLYYEDATGGDWGKDANIVVKHDKSHSSNSNNVYRARLYDDSTTKAPSIQPGRSAVYGIIAKVVDDFDNNTILTNTTGVIVDQAAITDEPNDELFPETPVGGKTYSRDSYKLITATADVITTGIYTPGIEKNLASYKTIDGWNTYTPNGTNDSFLPNNPMRWQITLHNGTNGHMTKGAIENYTVIDKFPLGLTYNEGDLEGNYIVSANGNKVELPLPAIEIEMANQEGGNSETERYVIATWKIEKQENGYLIIGADRETNTQITSEDLSIPAKGKLTMQVGTTTKGTAKYGTYVNQAELIPKEYEFSEACEGTLIRDDDNNAVSVRAEASVDILSGDGRTEAWKEIAGTFNGDEQIGTGKDSFNNSIIADAGSKITYTLNIRNYVEQGIENLVIADRLPSVKDNGLVNNMQRNSNFKVSFTENPDITVQIKKANGESSLLDKSDCIISYADWNTKFGKGSALPEKYWEPGSADGWTESSAGKDTFRIEVKNEALKDLKNDDTIVVTFDAQLPEADKLDLTQELIAWNTFGYAYKAVDSHNKSTITVEPAKVGVQIPTASLAVTKKVESRFEEDSKEQFTFSLEIEDGKNTGNWRNAGMVPYKLASGSSEAVTSETTTADGEFTLAHDQTAKFTVLAGRSYRIREKNAEGYYVTVTDFNGITDDSSAENSLLFDPDRPPTVTLEEASNGKNYYCTFKNSRSSFFLPETGGAGIDAFRRKGAGMLLLSLLMLAGCCTGCLFENRRKKEEAES